MSKPKGEKEYIPNSHAYVLRRNGKVIGYGADTSNEKSALNVPHGTKAQEALASLSGLVKGDSLAKHEQLGAQASDIEMKAIDQWLASERRQLPTPTTEPENLAELQRNALKTYRDNEEDWSGTPSTEEDIHAFNKAGIEVNASGQPILNEDQQMKLHKGLQMFDQMAAAQGPDFIPEKHIPKEYEQVLRAMTDIYDSYDGETQDQVDERVRGANYYNQGNKGN